MSDHDTPERGETIVPVWSHPEGLRHSFSHIYDWEKTNIRVPFPWRTAVGPEFGVMLVSQYPNEGSISASTLIMMSKMKEFPDVWVVAKR